MVQFWMDYLRVEKTSTKGHAININMSLYSTEEVLLVASSTVFGVGDLGSVIEGNVSGYPVPTAF